MIARKGFRRAVVWPQVRVLPPDASTRKRHDIRGRTADVHYAVAYELLADNEIRERYCSE
jgi:hypothetical protein